MRSAVLQMQDQRTAVEQRRVLRSAIRQLERADTYLAAISYMGIGEEEVQRPLRRLRSDVEALRRELHNRRVSLIG